MWKKGVIFLFGLLFAGCGSEVDEAFVSPIIPPHIVLQNEQGKSVGVGVPIQEGIFVTADHLRSKFGDLFWSEKKIDIVSRDFENDLLFFTFKNWSGFLPVWSDTPPPVGEDIFWLDESSILKRQKVRAIMQKISEETFQENRIVLSGSAQLPNSGSPVFGKNGRIFGIIVGADRGENISFAVRSDVIVRILQEHLE